MKVQLINLQKSFSETLKGKKSKSMANHKQFQSNQVYDEATSTITTHAVNKINIEIPSGKLVGLLGPSGCGKSTTLYMIAGLHDVTAGQVMFGDDDVTHLAAEKRGIGLVFQNYALYPHLTVEENIGFPLNNMRKQLAEMIKEQNLLNAQGQLMTVKEYIRATCQEMADLVGIGHLLDRKPKQLSGGQQQRVAIARALSKKPRILLLDEPLSNLDARLRLQTREEIKRIQRETGVTTVFVTHDQEEAMSISDEIVVMNYGDVQQQGVPQDVYNNPINEFVARFLGNPPINMFEGQIRDSKLFIGENFIKNVNLTDRAVRVGIRPEGFEIKTDLISKVKNVISPEGSLTLTIKQIEYVGRDVNYIMDLNGVKVHTVMPIDNNHTFKEGDVVTFGIKNEKVFVFDKETTGRIA